MQVNPVPNPRMSPGNQGINVKWYTEAGLPSQNCSRNITWTSGYRIRDPFIPLSVGFLVIADRKGDEMKPLPLVYIGIVLIAVGVTLAGCTGTAPSGTSGTSVPTPASTTPGTVSGLAPGATGRGSASVFGNSYNWFEYVTRMTVSGQQMTTTIRTEKSTGTYKGASATHYKNTMTSAMSTSVTDIYYDSSMNILGGTTTTTVQGKDYTMEIPAEQLKTQSGPSFEKQTTLIYQGPDSVTVPAGTYAAGKYLASTDGGAVTYWVAPNVPLPVKYSIGTPAGEMSAELKGWG